MRAAPRPDWGGRTVACLASGPSLTADDVELVRAAGLTTIVANTTFRLATWADALFGFDHRWWKEHIDEVKHRQFKGRLMGASPLSRAIGVEDLPASTWFRRFGNSGACAISVAVAGGASKIILLGYDCTMGQNGATHWHGNHPKGMSNCLSIKKWPYHFEGAAKYARQERAEILNCSRRTMLTCFKTATLEDVLTC